METFRSISITACFLGIAITIFSRLYPSEKFEKQMKTIFSLILVISIANPIASGKLELPDISEAVTANSDYYQSLSENTDDYFIKSIERNISINIEAELKEHNIFPLEINTNINISENNSISISEVSVTVDNAEYADEIKNIISSNTGDEVNVIVKVKEG